MDLNSDAAPQVPLYGYPKRSAESYRIAFFGDPWLGAGLARRHEVIWTRGDEAKHVSDLERPDLLLVTPRAEALRAFRTKPLVGMDGAVSSDCKGIITTFREAGIPVAFCGVTGQREFDRYLPVARMADIVAARTPDEANRYRDAGCNNVVLSEVGSFGYARHVLPHARAGRTALLEPYELTTGGVSALDESGRLDSQINVPSLAEALERIHAPRVGLETIRRAAWVGKDVFSVFHGLSALAVNAKWAQLATSTIYEAVLHGVTPVMYGQANDFEDLEWDADHLLRLDSLESCLHFGESLDSSWSYERHRKLAGRVAASLLSDDWIHELLKSVGARARHERIPLAIDGTLSITDPAKFVRVASVAQPNVVTTPFADVGATRGYATPYSSSLLVRADNQQWSGLYLSVMDADEFDADWLQLLFGWRRVARSRCVGVRNSRGELVATLRDGREGAECMINEESRPGVLAEAEVNSECA